MKKGYIVLTKSGKKGYAFHDEMSKDSKIKVRLINDKFKETGQNLLCEARTLKIIGFKD